MKKFLIALSGARSEVLERCKTDYGRFEGVGGAVLTTSVLAAISMTFALYSALGVSLFVAVPASLLWGLAIMSLDRWLVGTMQAGGPKRWLIALPRILMAVLLGVVISTPLVLQIFKSEIDVQMAQIKQERAENFANKQKLGAIGKEVEKLQQEVTGLEQVISSGGEVALDLNQDPKIKALTKDRDAEQKKADKRYKEWRCQLYGGPTCPSAGNGPLAQDSKKAYEKAKRRVDVLNGQIEDRKKELTTTGDQAKQSRLDSAKDALPAVQDQLEAARQQQSLLRKAFASENLETDGLLIRLEALNEVAGRNATLRTAQVLLFLLFLLIECLPVLVKLMQRPGNYEKVLALVQADEFRKARISFSTGSTSSPGATGGTDSVREVWFRDNEPSSTTVLRAPQERPEGATRPNPVGLVDEEEWPEDEALRAMRDLRTTHVPRRTEPGQERRGEFELLPDDD
jgi:hypothetical protein